MPLINLLNEQQRRREQENFRELGKSALSAGAIGVGVYTTLKSSGGFEENFNKAQNIVQGNRESMAKVGRMMRSDVDKVAELGKLVNESLIENIKTKLLSDEKLEEILTGKDASLEDRRALLTTLFDTYKSEYEGFDEGMRERLKAAYRNDTTLNQSDVDNIKRFYNQTILKDEDSTLKFNSSYSRFSRVKDMLVPNNLDFSTKPSTQVSFQTTTIDEFFKSQSNLFRDKEGQKTQAKIRKKFNQLTGLLGGARNIELSQIDEFGADGGIKSLYARIDYGQGLSQPIPLHLQTDKRGMKYYRGTSQLSTRYVAPLKVLNTLDLVKGGYGVQGNLNSAMVDFEDFIFDKFVSQDRGRIQNLGSREINNFNSFIRSFGPDAPRAMVERITSGVKGLVSQDLRENLALSRMMQSSTIYLNQIEQLAPEDQKNIISNLMQRYPDMFGGPGNQQTITTRIEDPFNMNRELKFLQINLLRNQAGQETFNSFSALKTFGRLDRGIVPQTARETQMFGRPEFLSGVVGDPVGAFGKKQNIQAFGRGGDLIGVSDQGGSMVRGANIASFMVLGKKAEQLGLSEGSAYSGGRFKLRTAITKTVTETGLETFDLMDVLQKRMLATDGDKFISVGSFKTDVDAGKYNIDEFFTRFGKDGEAILGRGDSGFIGLKRYKGMESFTLGIGETSMEGGRQKFNIVGERVQQLDFMKIFSSVFKGTMEPVSEAQIKNKVSQLGLSDQFDEFLRYANFRSTIVADDSMISKAPQYLATQIFGGFKYFGGDTDALEKAVAADIGGDAGYLDAIKRVASGDASAVKSLEDAPVRFRQAAFVETVARNVLEQGKAAKLSNQELGMILGGIPHFGDEQKFGLNKDLVDTIFKGHEDVLVEAKKGVAVGAAYAASGDVYSDLSRNVAKIEPRFANYLYQNLRHNFGASEKEATDYLASLMVRRSDVTEVSQSLLGMKTTQFSLSPGAQATALKKEIAALGDIRLMDQDAVKNLLGGASEKDIINVLSESKSGNIIDIKDLGLSQQARERLQKTLGGKDSFFLPGSETFEGMQEYKIRSGGKDVNIEAEYKRYVFDLTSSLSSLRDAGEDEDKIMRSIKGFETSRGLLGKVTGASIRRAVSGQILGSGTYRGRGISLGDEAGLGSKANLNQTQREAFKRIFEKTSGYGLGADAQAFMDGMSTFKEAARRDLMRTTGKADVDKEVSDLMADTLRRFFLGIYQDTPEGVMVDAQRNPLIGLSNIFGNIEMFRTDIGETEDDFFKRFKSEKTIEYTKKTKETKDAYKKIKDEELRNLNYKEEVKAKKAELRTALEADPEFKADIDLLKNKKAVYDQEIDKAIKGPLEQFGKKHGLQFTNYESFNKFLGIFLGEKGYAGSVSALNFREEGFDFGKALLDREGYLVRELKIADSAGDTELTGNISRLLKNIEDTSLPLRAQYYGLNIQDFRSLINEGGENLGGLSGVHGDLISAIRHGKQVAESKIEGPRGRVSQAIETNQELKDLRRDLHSQAEAATKQRVKDENVFETLGEQVVKKRSRLDKLAKIAGVDDFSSFKEVQDVRSSLSGDQLESFDRELGKQLQRMLKGHLSEGAQGGGTISFFDMKIASANVVTGEGKQVFSGGNALTFSGRPDINRAAIGDFDGDIYQVFFRTNQEKLVSGAPKKFMAAGLEMEMMMQELSKGMAQLGKRMNVPDMNLAAHKISEKEKERILKGVGGVDVQIKAGMLGLAQDAMESGTGESTRRMKAGMTLLAAAEEILVIKSKKLKMASNVPEEFVSAMRESFKTGKADRLKSFFDEHIFRDTDLKRHGELRLENIKFANLPTEGEGIKNLREAFGEARINLNEIYDSLDVMAANVKKYGYANMASDSRLTRAMTNSRVADANMLMQLLSSGGSLEGGFIGGSSQSLDEVERIFGDVKSLQTSMKNNFAKKAGAMGIAAALVGSYTIGSMTSPSVLDTPNKFSDMRVRENISTRGIETAMQRQPRSVPPEAMTAMDNFYERPIFSGETTVTSNTATRFYGEAASMPEMVQVGRRFIDAGGSASMSIQDNRLPISNNYITRSLKD